MVEEDEEERDASLQPQVTISRESPRCRAEHRERSQHWIGDNRRTIRFSERKATPDERRERERGRREGENERKWGEQN